MPRYIKQTETVDIHASWWGSKTILASDQVTIRESKTNADEETTWTERHTNERFAERCVLRAQMTERHLQRINERLYQKFRPGKSNAPVSPERMAKTRVYTFLEMIVEMTDENGRALPLSEADLATLDKRDADFIEAAIASLSEPAFPILETDEDEADRMSNDDQLADDQELTTANGRARSNFRSLRQTVTAG